LFDMANIINFKKIIMAGMAMAVAVTMMTPTLPGFAKVLRGGVQEENLRLQPSSGRSLNGRAEAPLRINRAPSALQGSAVDASAFAQPLNPRTAPLQSGVVDDNAFAQPPKNFDIGAERSSREMVLAWERWHKQLSEAIYTRWQRIARDPGKATLRVTITNDRHIMATILRSDGGPEFDSVIMEAIESLDGNPGLTFPAKSERRQVSFEADYIAAAHVKPGFSWVKNDYEKVRQDY
jgi:hypothetical protein